MLNGFVNLYKPEGITSYKAISILKRLLKQNNIITKVGHFGTLDPMAQGVLPVALGRATRLFDYFLEKKKVYIAEFYFGEETDTLDRQGTVINRIDKIINKENVSEVIPSLIGEIEQLPPKYSAKSVNGQRAYDLARKGIEFELKPKNIIIYDIRLLEQTKNNTFLFEITCSGGTYIRAIARDMAYLLNTFGTMTYLKRTASGTFDVNTTVAIDEIEKDICSNILPMDIAIKDFKVYYIDEQQKIDLLNGKKNGYNDLPQGFFAVYEDQNLIGMGRSDEQQRLEIKTWLI